MPEQSQIEVRDRRRKEFFFMDDEYLNGYAKLCGNTATLMYMSLCRHANKDQRSWPSFKLLREEHGIGSDHTIVGAIKSLEKWGIITIERSKDETTKRQKPNVYTLMDKSCWKPKPTALNAPGSIAKPTAVEEQSRLQFGHESRLHPVQCKETQGEGNTKKDTPKGVGAGPQSRMDPFVNQIIGQFEDIMDVREWADSVKTRRRYAHLVQTARKWTLDQTRAILMAAKTHPRHCNWCKMSDLYYRGVELLREVRQKIEKPYVAVIPGEKEVVCTK